MSLVYINNIFIFVMIIALIFSVIDKKIKQTCFIDFLSVLGAVFGVVMMTTATSLNYTLESTLFFTTMCIWAVVSIYRKFKRSRQL